MHISVIALIDTFFLQTWRVLFRSSKKTCTQSSLKKLRSRRALQVYSMNNLIQDRVVEMASAKASSSALAHYRNHTRTLRWKSCVPGELSRSCKKVIHARVVEKAPAQASSPALAYYRNQTHTHSSLKRLRPKRALQVCQTQSPIAQSSVEFC